MFKSQLQEYAQKAGLPVPVYDVTKEGPSHGPQFKASVTIRGKAYESPQFFANLKKAEHAAAEIALAALGKAETGQLHDSGLLKNLLQEYAQKCKLPLPFYTVVKTGDVQSPMYSATVEIGGVYYEGGKCKTRKEAEIKAARKALVAIHVDSSASFLNSKDDQVEDEKPASTEINASVVPKSGVEHEQALTSVETRVESKSAVEEVASTDVSVRQPKSGNKRKKLFKAGKEVQKRAVKEEQTQTAEKAAGNIEKVASMLEQANGSPSKGSGPVLPSQALKQELLAQGRQG